MPALGADMEAGTIIEWLVKPGDAVKRGDIIAVVDTEKATIEVEVFESGIIEKIVVPEGEKVPIGTVLALIGGVGAAPSEPKAKRAPPPPSAAAPVSAVAAPRAAAPIIAPILRPPVAAAGASARFAAGDADSAGTERRSCRRKWNRAARSDYPGRRRTRRRGQGQRGRAAADRARAGGRDCAGRS